LATPIGVISPRTMITKNLIGGKAMMPQPRSWACG
jgi:hypothetical protein